MVRRLIPLLLAAACASTAGGAAIEARAAREARGVRVYFRCDERGAQGVPPTLRPERGAIEEVAVAPDRRAVSALWVGAEGGLRCIFPYAGSAELSAGEAEGARGIEYVFLERDGARVSAEVPFPVVRRVEFRVEAPGGAAAIDVRGGPPIAVLRDRATFELPLDEEGALAEGAVEMALRGRDGRVWPFVVEVDSDGALSAATGFVRKW